MKPVVADKDIFQCRDNSNNVGFLEILDYQDSDAKKITDMVCHWIFTSFKLPAENKTEDIEPLVTENQEVQYRDKTL